VDKSRDNAASSTPFIDFVRLFFDPFVFALELLNRQL
jgi:hypothetical protein